MKRFSLPTGQFSYFSHKYTTLATIGCFVFAYIVFSKRMIRFGTGMIVLIVQIWFQESLNVFFYCIFIMTYRPCFCMKILLMKVSSFPRSLHPELALDSSGGYLLRSLCNLMKISSNPQIWGDSTFIISLPFQSLSDKNKELLLFN